MSRALAFLLTFLAFPPLLGAQADPSQLDPKKNCDLSVRVRTPAEWRVDTPILIKVLSPVGTVDTVNLVGEESAHFRVTSGRSYRLEVSGSAIQTVRTSYFVIESLEQEHTETVYVKALDTTEKNKSAPGPGTISVSEMNIPKKASAEMQKGLNDYSKGDMQKAGAHFEKATAEYPQYARAYDMLGVLAIRKPDRGRARELFEKSIAVDGTYSPAYVDLARMDVQDRHYADSESLLEKAISFNPSLPDAMALLATTEFINKEYDKALADVERTHALRDHEAFAEVHVLAGKVLANQHHPDLAIAQFELFLKEKPDSPEAASIRKTLASLQAQAANSTRR